MPESLYSIYVVVREDLEPGRVAAQAAHAVAGLVNQAYSFDFGEDFETSVVCKGVEFGRMIVLGVPGLQELAAFGLPLLGHFMPYGQPFRMYSFAEPDLGYQLTASAFLVHKSEEAFFSQLPLAFKPAPKRKWWQRGN